jgi:heme oxygenase (biliverdin-IX-beta and delta-forming)
VLEGAALGGAVLAPRIERHLGLRPGEATAHWRGAGPDTAGRWRAFRARLDAWGDGRDPADHDRAVHAAERTFDLVAGALRRALDAPA